MPDNVVAAAVNMNILGIITFSLFFGLCLSQLGDQADALISLINVRPSPSKFCTSKIVPKICAAPGSLLPCRFLNAGSALSMVACVFAALLTLTTPPWCREASIAVSF